MDKDIRETTAEHFLDDVTGQISYKPLRPSIRRELEEHLQDCMEYYESQGYSLADAEKQAVRSMGDATTVGTGLNDAHRLQSSPLPACITVLLFLTGIAFSVFMRWRPEEVPDISRYYIAAALLFLFTALKGYPLLVRHRKKLVFLLCILYLSQMVIFYLASRHGFLFGTATTAYCATLLFALVATFQLYCYRRRIKRALVLVFGSAIVWLLLMYYSTLYIADTAAVIFLLSTFCTVCFMIRRGVLCGKKRYLYSGALACLAVLGSLFFYTGCDRGEAQAFLSPQSAVSSVWDDTYNSVLIRELLSRTPFTHGLELTSGEMMDYGTGAWYFAGKDPTQIGIDISQAHTDEFRQEFRRRAAEASGRGFNYRPCYVDYSSDNVTVWDILPPHYRSDYLIAVCIIIFGWLPGLVLMGGVILLYLSLFCCISRIHGYLASSLAFCCGQCLLWQGIFYLSGNLGHQYSTFPNLPLLSEGRASILFNMLLLGLIFSAYRYDRVVDEPDGCSPAAAI